MHTVHSIGQSTYRQAAIYYLVAIPTTSLAMTDIANIHTDSIFKEDPSTKLLLELPSDLMVD